MKNRLDKLLILRKHAVSIKEAQALIGSGVVYVNDEISDKAGNLHDFDDNIRVKAKSRYVSRGGQKLEKGLEHFSLDVSHNLCIDVGASSGGFTDCLLQHGAERVYAVDVAYGQLSWKLRQDPRVTVIERFNARKLTPEIIPEKLDLAVIDASFISLKKLIPPLLPLLKANKAILALIKPQFEAPKENVGPGGVVTDKSVHEEIIEDITRFGGGLNLSVEGVTPSPILGPKGNKEFIILFT